MFSLRPSQNYLSNHQIGCKERAARLRMQKAGIITPCTQTGWKWPLKKPPRAITKSKIAYANITFENSILIKKIVNFAKEFKEFKNRQILFLPNSSVNNDLLCWNFVFRTQIFGIKYHVSRGTIKCTSPSETHQFQRRLDRWWCTSRTLHSSENALKLVVGLINILQNNFHIFLGTFKLSAGICLFKNSIPGIATAPAAISALVSESPALTALATVVAERTAPIAILTARTAGVILPIATAP